MIDHLGLINSYTVIEGDKLCVRRIRIHIRSVEGLLWLFPYRRWWMAEDCSAGRPSWSWWSQDLFAASLQKVTPVATNQFFIVWILLLHSAITLLVNLYIINVATILLIWSLTLLNSCWKSLALQVPWIWHPWYNFQSLFTMNCRPIAAQGINLFIFECIAHYQKKIIFLIKLSHWLCLELTRTYAKWIEKK